MKTINAIYNRILHLILVLHKLSNQLKNLLEKKGGLQEAINKKQQELDLLGYDDSLQARLKRFVTIILNNILVVLGFIIVVAFDLGSLHFVIVKFEQDLSRVIPYFLAAIVSRCLLLSLELLTAFWLWEVRRLGIGGWKKYVALSMAVILVFAPATFIILQYFYADESLVSVLTFATLSIVSHILLFYFAERLFSNAFKDSLSYIKKELECVESNITDTKVTLSETFFSYDDLLIKWRSLSEKDVTELPEEIQLPKELEELRKKVFGVETIKNP